MPKEHAKKLFYAIIIAVILGALAGWILGEDALMFSWMGTLFLNALKMILMPLIVAAVITGMASLGDIVIDTHWQGSSFIHNNFSLKDS